LGDARTWFPYAPTWRNCQVALLDARHGPLSAVAYEAGQCELTPLRLDQSALSRLRELQARRRARQATACLFLSLPTAAPSEIRDGLKRVWASMAGK
jgi:hypothetical protein